MSSMQSINGKVCAKLRMPVCSSYCCVLRDNASLIGYSSLKKR